MKKLLYTALASGIACVALALPSTAAAATDPILFVHGFGGQASGWDTFRGWFVQDGWDNAELYASSYNNAQSNEDTAQEIFNEALALQASTGATKIDVVTHSMGGLSGRFFVKNLGGELLVDDFVSIAGPNHGTPWAWGCVFLAPCSEMTPNSAFLQALNAGDETPGDVSYATWRSICDVIVPGPTTTPLDGATNNNAGCKEHISMNRDRQIYEGVRDFID